MTTPAWQPGTLYLPGALVVPRTAPPPSPVAVTNGDFESGAVNWNFGGNVVTDTGVKFSGTTSLMVNGTGDITLLNSVPAACVQGQVVNASCMYAQGAASAGDNTGRVLLQFLDAASAVLSTVQGNVITSSSGGWKKSSVTGVAPANTAFVKIGAFSHKTKSAEHRFDLFQWDVTSVTQGLLYKAVQPASGTSGNVEPAWPTTLGVTVVDNTVTWEAVAISRIVWSPQAAMVSGATEPTWPTGMGTRVADGQVAWEAIPRRIEDENCPHSKVVVIASSKVYAADDDVVRYSATVNPYDWSTANDAGYLPYGLQQYGANPIAAMGLYRSNLVIFNANAFHMWQVDEDPANSALLDALPIGSTWHKALAPVSNDLFFLSAQGVRTVSIAGGSTNLAAGDVGMPIDPLVQEAMLAATGNSTKALATYVPSAGQYWLAFRDPDPTPPEPVMQGHFIYQVGETGPSSTRRARIGYGQYNETSGAFTYIAHRDFQYGYGSWGHAGFSMGGALIGRVYYDNDGDVGAQVSGIYALTYNGTSTLQIDAAWRISTAKFQTYYDHDKLDASTVVVIAQTEFPYDVKLWALNYAPGSFSVVGSPLLVSPDNTGDYALCVHNGFVMVLRQATDASGFLRAYSYSAGTFTLVDEYTPIPAPMGAVHDEVVSDGNFVYLGGGQIFTFDGTTIALVTQAETPANLVGCPAVYANRLAYVDNQGDLRSYTFNGTTAALTATLAEGLDWFGNALGLASGRYLRPTLDLYPTMGGVFEWSGSAYSRIGDFTIPNDERSNGYYTIANWVFPLT